MAEPATSRANRMPKERSRDDPLAYVRARQIAVSHGHVLPSACEESLHQSPLFQPSTSEWQKFESRHCRVDQVAGPYSNNCWESTSRSD